MANPLTDALTPTARKYVYAVLFVVGLVLTAWRAADGDWLQAVAVLVASLGGPGMAASNINKGH